MKFELDILREDVAAIPKDVSGRHAPLTIVGCRKANNVAANELIHNALLKNDLPALREGCATVMLVVASNLLRLGEEPELEDFVYACSELITTTRSSLDKALQSQTSGDIRLVSVMMEVVIRGICACTDTNYEEKFNEIVAGLRQPDGAVNDE